MHFTLDKLRFAPLFLLIACGSPGEAPEPDSLGVDKAVLDARVRPSIYVPVKLTADLSTLSEEDRQMLPLLIEAAQIMDTLFWQEAWGAPDSIPVKEPVADLRSFFHMNYGPWDRMDGDKPFMDGMGEKPKGARFYPADMTDAEFSAWEDPAKKSLYTMVRRDSAGALVAIPYHTYFQASTERAAQLLDQAAELAKDPGLKAYLTTRAQALRTDDYHASDLAWMDMRTNAIDLIIGPIETYEDQRYGYKASHESYVLIKDTAWTARLERFAKLLPGLQRGLPVPAAYKKEKPGSDGQLGAYDVIYYAGACNAGGKTIAVNLPNDESIQLQKGTRRLQLKNAMKAKFDKIVVPIAD
ncbi:MAG: Zn-dependent hydrolase, partial [Flavobacteriales bacterium]